MTNIAAEASRLLPTFQPTPLRWAIMDALYGARWS